MTPFKIALDWTPNINHLGFFVAQDLGFYREAGLDVSLIDPSEDAYAVTPAKKVELGRCDMTLCPTESIISYRTKKSPFEMVGIAAIYQRDLSAIVAHAEGKSAAARPAELDGKRYASFQARYEDAIVKQLIRNDGGSGDFKIEYPKKLGIWNTLIEGGYDASWIFLNWEGADRKLSNSDIQLNYFRLEDYKIPYSYSPLLAANKAILSEANASKIRALLSATRKGYLLAQTHPAQAIEILGKYVPECDQDIDLEQALSLSAAAFGDRDTWGHADPTVVNRFLDWLREMKLEPQRLQAEEIITADYL